MEVEPVEREAAVLEASPEPFAFFNAPDGVTNNAAQTHDAGTLTEVLEHSRLIDANGVTACDIYFGWGGREPDPTPENEILCGKYQFLYEHFGTPGIPDMLAEFWLDWYPDMTGNELERFGYIPDPNPRRQVSDVRFTPAGACVRTERRCTARLLICLRWEDVCVERAERDLYREVYTLAHDDFPVGLVPSPQLSLGFESTAFTCASCHVDRTADDGRYVIGMANQRQSYGAFVTSLSQPLQATMVNLVEVVSDSSEDGPFAALRAGIPELAQLRGAGDLMSGLRMHPEQMFNDKATVWSSRGAGFEAAYPDLRVGTCFYRDPAKTDLIQCDLANESAGSVENRARAAELREVLTNRHGDVYTGDWPWAMQLYLGDAYCVPAPRKPSDYGHSNDLPYGVYEHHWLDPAATLESMHANCEGNRWDADYWRAVVRLFADLGRVASSVSVPVPTMSETDAFLRMLGGQMDFLEAPLTDDDQLTISTTAPVFGFPTDDELALYPDQVTDDGTPTILTAHSGSGIDIQAFLEGFVLMSASVDPRYIECDNPGIVGSWGAKPDGSCRAKPESLAPLAAYVRSLRAPYPASPPADPEPGRLVFEAECASCHAGPRGETPGVFYFTTPDNEGLAPVPDCPADTLSVEWNDGTPRTPTFNECRPVYADPERSGLMPQALGLIGTDPTYSRLFNPDSVDGIGDATPELWSLRGANSQGVRGMRLTGTQYRRGYLHHGGVASLDELLCSAGTRRATPADRARRECLMYDLDTPEALGAYRAGNGTCLEDWAPLQGHEFGCDLTVADKAALIEYLRSL